MDAFAYARERAAKLRGQFAWPPSDAQDLNAWGDGLRQRISQALGAQDEPFPELAIETFHTAQEDGFTREALTFATRDGMRAFGYLLTPEKPLGPGILCIPGHGAGVDGLAGIGEEDYHHRYAVVAARRGWTVFAIEPISFGRRRSEPIPDEPGESTCHRDSTAALMLGETMAGWRVRDARAALRLLASRPGVDPTKLATIGISGGGTVSFLTGVLEPMVSVAVVSGYYNTFQDSILSVHHCVDNYVPGILNIGEMPDLVAAIAPRRFFAASGTRDPIFPAPAFLRACEQAQAIYQAHGVPDRFGYELFEGGHEFHGEGAFAALDRWLD